jgi:hypothetical protein
MAGRQEFTQRGTPDPGPKKVTGASQLIPVCEEELAEQRRNLAFGLCQGKYDINELNVGVPRSASNPTCEAARLPACSETKDAKQTG